MKVWFSVAAVEDIADFIAQENNYISFVSNTGKKMGRDLPSYSIKMKEPRELAQRTEKIYGISLGCTSDNQNVRES